MSLTPLLILSALVGTMTVSQAADLDFYRDVYPFLKVNCISCHNKTTTKAALNMESPEMLKKGGETGPGLVPGKSADSLIVQAARHTHDLEMPPANNKSGAVDLTPAEITLLQAWIDQGAKQSIQQERELAWHALPAGVQPIYSVAMTQDGQLAACGRANHIYMYDLATRQFATQLSDAAPHASAAHRALVQSLAFSPDGLRLASGSFREVKIWRQEKGEAMQRKATPKTDAAISVLTPDGRQIISVDTAGALLVLEAASGKVLNKIAGAAKVGMMRLSVSPDASRLVTYDAEMTLGLWNLRDGKGLASKLGVKGVQAIGWTADSHAFATAGEDHILRLWSPPLPGSTEFGAPQEIKGATGAIHSLIPGATPDQLITTSDSGKLHVWSHSEAKIIREIAGVSAGAGTHSLALSHDGKQIAIGAADGAVQLWDLASGKPTVALRGNMASSQQIAALEWTIAAQSLEQAFQKSEGVRIAAQNTALDILLKKATETIATMKKALPEKQQAAKPTQAAKAATQKLVADLAARIAQTPKGTPDTTLDKQLKDAQDKLASAAMVETSALAAVSAVESNIADAEADVQRITEAKAKNSKSLAASVTASAAGKKLQDKATADLTAAKQAVVKGTTKPLAIAFSTDGQKVAAIGTDGTLYVWAAATGALVEQVASRATTAATLVCNPQGIFIACHADGTLVASRPPPRWVLERTLGNEHGHALFADRVNAVRFSPDGKTLATGGGEPSRSGDISLFEVATGKLLKSWKERHEDTVLSLDFSPNGKLLASGAADKMARVTDIASGRQIQLFEGHTHHVTGISFRADGRVLATAGADGVVMAWDMILGERKKKIEGWTKEVTSLQFIGATNQLITSAGDNLVRIVSDEGTEIRVLAKLPDFMQSAASSANGNTLIGGGEDSQLRVWDGSNGKELIVFGTK